MVIALKAEFSFELLADFPQRPVKLIRLVVIAGGRVDLVDCDVNMQVVGVPVNSTDPLMVCITQRRANTLFNLRQRFI